MVGLVGDVVRASPLDALIDRAVVSTDHDEIARVAEAHGLEAPFRRPESLSSDRIGDVDVLTHALEATEADDGAHYDIIVMLQPTSPLRRPEHVVATIEKLVDEGWDAVWTVSETDSKAHPLKQLILTGGEAKAGGKGEPGEALGYYDPAGAQIIARQQLGPVYHRNGIAYALTRRCLLEHKSLMGPRTGALVLDGHFVSIDTEWDIALVEWILAQEEEARFASAPSSTPSNGKERT